MKIIVYNVTQADAEKAIMAGLQAYQARYGQEATKVSLPARDRFGLVLLGSTLTIQGQMLQVDRFFSAPGTIMVGR